MFEDRGLQTFQRVMDSQGFTAHIGLPAFGFLHGRLCCCTRETVAALFWALLELPLDTLFISFLSFFWRGARAGVFGLAQRLRPRRCGGRTPYILFSFLPFKTLPDYGPQCPKEGGYPVYLLDTIPGAWGSLDKQAPLPAAAPAFPAVQSSPSFSRQ